MKSALSTATSGVVLSTIVACALSGCSSIGKSSTPTGPGAAPKEVAKLSKPSKVASNDTFRAVYAPAKPANPASNVAPRAEKMKAGSKGDVRDIYRKVAPATVLIRTPNGLGTGVVIDRAGWILTNWHVVADGESGDDLRLEVWVDPGRMNEGVMELTGKSYEALVYKGDPAIDLAVIKLKDPPPDLVAVPIARDNPTPGEPITSIGHAAIGMLWSIKDCEISSVGKLENTLAELALYPCVGKEGVRPAAARAECAERQQRYEQTQKYLSRATPAFVIQSTCQIWPGDSGGPVVNRAGELVGLNAFGHVGDYSEGFASFHIHVREIREFVKEVPAQAPQMLPDPWREGGEEAVIADGDLDGKPDLLLLEGEESRSVFFDTDQNSFAGRTAPSDAAEVYANKSFDAEAITNISSKASAYYDTDNDGVVDLLLIDDDNDGVTDNGYRRTGSEFRRQDQLAGGKLIQPTLLNDSAQQARFSRLAEVLFDESVVEPASDGEVGLPDPRRGGGDVTEVMDADENGVVDCAIQEGMFSGGVLIDVDENSLPRLSGKDGDEAVQADAVDAELAVIKQGNRIWTFYDRNDDAVFDLALASDDADSGAAQRAFTLAKGGAPTAVDGYTGRLLIRPALMGTGPAAKKLDAIAQGFFSPYIVALPDDGLGSFPRLGAGDSMSAEFADVPGAPRAVVIAEGDGNKAILIDLDQSTFKGKSKAPEDLASFVAAGKFQADLIYMMQGESEWIYYDTNGDKVIDLVLFTSHPATGASEIAYRIGPQGKVTVDEAAAQGKLLRRSLFRNKALSDGFAKIVSPLFKARAVEN